MPEGEELENLARTKATLAIHLSVRNLREIENVLTPIYGAECPVVIAYRVGWPDQQFLYGSLANIRKKVMAAKITRTALIFIGRGLNHDDRFRTQRFMTRIMSMSCGSSEAIKMSVVSDLIRRR